MGTITELLIKLALSINLETYINDKSEYFSQMGIERNIKWHKELTPPKAIKLAPFGININKVTWHTQLR